MKLGDRVIEATRLGDARIVLEEGDAMALADFASDYFTDSDTANVIAVVESDHQHLQRQLGFNLRGRNILENGVIERPDVHGRD